jgi:hypothetical protein
MTTRRPKSTARYSIQKIQPSVVAPNGEGGYVSGSTISFIVPPSAIRIVNAVISGSYRFAIASNAAIAIQAFANQFYALDPKCGAYGLFSTVTLYRAFSFNVIETITDVPRYAASISISEHNDDFINGSCGTLVEPHFRDVAGYNKMSYMSQRASTPNYYRDFYYQPLLGCLTADTKMNVGLAGGLQFDFVVSRFSECANQWLPWADANQPALEVQSTTQGFTFPMQNEIGFQRDIYGGIAADMRVPREVPLIRIQDPVLWVLAVNAGPETTQSFIYTTTQILKTQMPLGPNIVLGIPISYMSIKTIQFMVSKRFSLVRPEISNLSTAFIRYNDFRLRINGTPQFYAYPTIAANNPSQISSCSTNQIVSSAANNIFRRRNYANVFNGRMFEVNFDLTGNGVFFERSIFTYDLIQRSPYRANEGFFPFTRDLLNDASIGLTDICEQSYVDLANTFVVLPDRLRMDVPAINQTNFSGFYVNYQESWPIHAPPPATQLRMSAIGNPHMKYYDQPIQPSNRYDMIQFIRSSSTLVLSSVGSQRTGDVPPSDLLPDELDLQHAAAVSGIKRVVETDVIGVKVQFTDPFVEAWEFQLPDQGIAAEFTLMFKVQPIKSRLEPGAPAFLAPQFKSENFWYNRWGYPSVLGSAAFLDSIDIQLPNGVTIQRNHIAETAYLENFNTSNDALITQTEFTSHRSNGWYKPTNNNAAVQDIVSNRLENRAFDIVNSVSAAPDDSRLGTQVFRLSLGEIDDAIRQLEGTPLSSFQKRKIIVRFDLRGIAFANVPCGAGCGGLCEPDITLWDLGYVPESSNGYPAGNLGLTRGNFKRYARVGYEIDTSYTPTLRVQQVFHSNEQMQAIIADFATNGATYELSQFNFQYRYSERIDYGVGGRIDLPVVDTQVIGGRNPAVIFLTHRPLRNIDGVMHITENPGGDEPPTSNNRVSSLFITNPFSVMRDGLIGASFMQDSHLNSGQTNLHTEYELTIDDALVHPFYIGTPVCNSIMYAIATNEPIQLPHFMISNQSDGRFQLPNMTTFQQLLGVWPATVNWALRGQANPVWVNNQLQPVVSMRNNMAPAASRFVVTIPIPPEFQNGNQLTLTQKTNVSLSSLTPIFFGADQLDTEDSYFVPVAQRTWATLESATVFFNASEARMRVNYPTGYLAD